MSHPFQASCQCTSPACSELKLFSASSALQAVAGADAVKTGSGLAGTSAGPAAPSGEPVVSRVPVVVAVEPNNNVGGRGNKKKHTSTNDKT